VRTVLSRVTLVMERRRVELVLPSREPIGLLLPEVVRILDERAARTPESGHLVTADGSVLGQDSTLESAGLPDGAVLRLVRVADAPATPVAHDVTHVVTHDVADEVIHEVIPEVADEVARDLDVRAWRWRPPVRRVVAGVFTVFWALAAGTLARDVYELASVGGWLLLAAIATALAGALCGRARQQGLATTLIVTAGALGALGAWTSADAYGWSGALRLAGVAAPVMVALLLAGWFSPLGRGALVGAAAVAGCLVLWEEAAAL
jgi:hypothetical protein